MVLLDDAERERGTVIEELDAGTVTWEDVVEALERYSSVAADEDADEKVSVSE